MKYNISKEFGILRNYHATLNPVVLRLAKVFLSIFPKGIKSSKDLLFKNFKITTRDNKKVKIYIFKPKNVQGKLPVIFYFHGGAFAFKGAPYQYAYAKEYARKTKSVVVFVDYRLSYCSPFNAPLNDCVDVYKYMLENADNFGINTDKIIVAGDSAGGFLSVMTVIKAKELDLKLPKLQMLLYPVLDCRCKTKSMETFTDTPFWDSKLNKKMWKIYLKGNSITPPIEMESLAFMPTTYIETAEFDCLHDEAIEFYNKIKITNPSSVLYETKQTMHGYDFFKKSKITQNAFKNRIDFLNNINLK